MHINTVIVWVKGGGGLQVHVIRYHDIYWNNIMFSDVILMFSLFISERVNNAVKCQCISINNAYIQKNKKMRVKHHLLRMTDDASVLQFCLLNH